MNKFIVPVALLLVAIFAGVGVWWVLYDPTPRPLPENAAQGNQTVPPRPERNPLELSERDFNPAALSPDPVSSERPKRFSAEQPPARVVASGRVVDAVGLAVADARVVFVGENALNGLTGTAYTDGTGRYMLVAYSAARTGTLQGQFAATAWAGTADGRVGYVAQVQLPSAETVEVPDIALGSGGGIEGRVVAQDGTPVTGVRVSARSLTHVKTVVTNIRNPQVQDQLLTRSVWTDETGRFVFSGLPSTKYHLNVDQCFFGADRGGIDVEVPAAGNAWAEVPLLAEHWVRGVLRDSEGQPVPGAVVNLLQTGKPVPAAVQPPANPNELRAEDVRATGHVEADTDVASRVARSRLRGMGGVQCLTDGEGRFWFFGVRATEHALVARLAGSESRLDGVQPGQPDYTLTVTADTVVSGLVRDGETGQPLTRYDLRLVMAGEDKVSPFDRVADDRPFATHLGGEFRLINPAAGPLKLRVAAPGYAPALVDVGTIATGDRKRDLEVRLKPLCNLDLVLLHEGRRLDLEPALLLFDKSLAYEAASDDRGTVRLPQVAPTAYTVRVILRDGTRLKADLNVPAKGKAALEVALQPE